MSVSFIPLHVFDVIAFLILDSWFQNFLYVSIWASLRSEADCLLFHFSSAVSISRFHIDGVGWKGWWRPEVNTLFSHSHASFHFVPRFLSLLNNSKYFNYDISSFVSMSFYLFFSTPWAIYQYHCECFSFLLSIVYWVSDTKFNIMNWLARVKALSVLLNC